MTSLVPHAIETRIRPRAFRWGAALVSLGVHGLVIYNLGTEVTKYPKAPPLIVELAALPPAPPPVQEPLEKPVEEPPLPEPAAPSARALSPKNSLSPPEQAPMGTPQKAAPIALAGVVLSNSGTDFGVDFSNRSRSASPRATSIAAAPLGPAPAKAPAAVALADLSRKPQAPELGGTLRQHYPPEHRRNGTPGQASVRVLLSEHGRVMRAEVTTESATGFGEACRKTLLNSRWSAPVDRAGNAVRTELTYRCKFTIDS
jgi:outer membrane biosynthesis protein TonB